MPDRVIAPYDYTLAGQKRDEWKRISWMIAADVRCTKAWSWTRTGFIVLAGERYRDGLVRQDLPFVAPLQGMGIGEQLAALTEANRTGAAIHDDRELDNLVQRTLDIEQRQAARLRRELEAGR